MSTATDFKTLLDNIKIDNAGQISKRYGRITKALNQYFYNLDSKTANSLQVGSYGRFTGIRGISISICFTFYLQLHGQDSEIDNRIYYRL